MTVAEFIQRTEAGETITANDVDLTDPPLGHALQQRPGWTDFGAPAHSIWDLDGTINESDPEFAQPLSISVEIRDGGPRWCAHYPAPDEQAREPDETFNTREELLNALDRIETHSQTATAWPHWRCRSAS